MGGYVSTGSTSTDQNFELTNDRLVRLESEVLRLKAQMEKLTMAHQEEMERREKGREKFETLQRLNRRTYSSVTAGRAPSSLDV